MAHLRVPKQGERLFALGNSGTGKTTLVKSLFKAIENGIAIDTKNDEDWEDAGEIIEGDKIFNVAEGRYVWRPPSNFPFDEDYQNEFFLWALEAGNRAIYVDEFGDVCPSAQQYPRGLKLCIMRGRSRRLGIWGTTQEPLRVPSFLFGQAQHRYVFHLGHPDQQKRASDYFETRIPFDQMPLEYVGGQPIGSKFVYRDPEGRIFGPTRLDLPQATVIKNDERNDN